MMTPAEARTYPYTALIGAGTFAGFVLGAGYGYREWDAALEAAKREGLVADYLPVGIPIWAVIGSLPGAFASAALMLASELISTYFRFWERGKGAIDDRRRDASPPFGRPPVE